MSTTMDSVTVARPGLSVSLSFSQGATAVAAAAVTGDTDSSTEPKVDSLDQDSSHDFQPYDYSSHRVSHLHRSDKDRRRVRAVAAAAAASSNDSSFLTRRSTSSAIHTTRREESEEEAERKSHGGWSSINVPGQPYKPLGEPILDFVFQVKRRNPSVAADSVSHDFATSSAYSGSEEKEVGSSGSGHRAFIKAGNAADSMNSSWSKKSSSPSNNGTGISTATGVSSSGGVAPIPSNSLDLTDPVRDLLALCTPRRADVIDATAAIRERVTLSEARIRTVKAGGSFDSIDHFIRKKRDIQKFERDRAEGLPKERQHVFVNPVHSFSSMSSIPNTHRNHQHPELKSTKINSTNHQIGHAPTTVAGLDTYGSRLMHSSFMSLSKLMNDGSVGIHTPANALSEFQIRRLGGPFRVNFEGNVFQNLPPHPLFEKRTNINSSTLHAQSRLSSPSSSLSANLQTEIDEVDIGGGDRSHKVNEEQQVAEDEKSIESARLNEISARDRRKFVLSAAGSQSARGTRAIQNHPNSHSISVHPHHRHHSSSLTVHSTSSALSQIEASIHHTHAPPTSLNFHQLRYTLHQSFGTELYWKKEQESRSSAAAVAAIKKRAQRLNSATAAVVSLDNAETNFLSSAATPEDSEIALINHPPSSSSRSALLPTSLASGASGTGVGRGIGVSVSTDREYVRAVAASKFRREHNNSPTSHWIRLQDNVQQRYAQAKALTNMAYFNPEGNLFQQGGLLVKEASATSTGAPEAAQAQSSTPDAINRVSAPPHSSLHGSSTDPAVFSNGLTFGMSPSRKGRGGQMSRTIHSGQILRQVSNTNWDSFLQDEQQQQQQSHATHATHMPYSLYDDDGPNRRRHADSIRRQLPEQQSSITKRAELTLARCYADFDLAKKDLKERLYEGLALMDSERDELVLRKYAHFQPDFSSAESDILRMRIGAEKKRYTVLQERLESLEKLYELVSFINYNNGGNNGDENSGMIGNMNGAALPTFEEIYVVEVLASLIDSGVPMCPHHHDNQVGEFAMPQDHADDAPVKVGRFKDSAINGIHPTLFAIHANHIKQANTLPIATTSELQSVSALHMLPSNSSSLNSRRGSNLAMAGASSLQPSPQHLSGFSASNRTTPSIPAHTPPPSFLFLLLCLTPSVLKLKEVRESLDRWARLTGVSEEAVENALRMVGVDPRLATYSGRGALKASNANGAGLSAAQLLMLNEGTLALDTDTKNALLKSAIDSVLPAAPVSRPLTTVVLTPVSLGEWEGRKRRERVKQSARDLERRVKAVRDLTVSSNASTRISLNLTQPMTAAATNGTAAHLQGSPRQGAASSAFTPTSPSVRIQPNVALNSPRQPSSSSSTFRQLSSLSEEEASVSMNASSRGMPIKQRTGESKVLQSQHAKDKIQLVARM